MMDFVHGALATLVLLTLVKSAPIVYAALGGVISERSGIVNIGLEGMMTGGAFAAVVASYATGNAAVGLVAGVAVGALLGFVLGYGATKFKVDQIVAGMGINLIAAGGAAYGLVLLYNQPGASPQVHALGRWYWLLILFAFVCAFAL
ncbi:MAG: ABC transporter permease subunit, partial [Vulcanimicrobiaceae bacterium]